MHVGAGLLLYLPSVERIWVLDALRMLTVWGGVHHRQPRPVSCTLIDIVSHREPTPSGIRHWYPPGKTTMLGKFSGSGAAVLRFLV